MRRKIFIRTITVFANNCCSLWNIEGVWDAFQDQFGKIVESFASNLCQLFQILLEGLDIEVVQVRRDEDRGSSHKYFIPKHYSNPEKVFLCWCFLAEFVLKKLWKKLEAIQLDQHHHLVNGKHELIELKQNR